MQLIGRIRRIEGKSVHRRRDIVCGVGVVDHWNRRVPDQRRIHVKGIIPRITEAIIFEDNVAAYPGNDDGSISARGNRLARHARKNRVCDAEPPALTIAEAETNQVLKADPVKRNVIAGSINSRSVVVVPQENRLPDLEQNTVTGDAPCGATGNPPLGRGFFAGQRNAASSGKATAVGNITRVRGIVVVVDAVPGIDGGQDVGQAGSVFRSDVHVVGIADVAVPADGDDGGDRRDLQFRP